MNIINDGLIENLSVKQSDKGLKSSLSRKFGDQFMSVNMKRKFENRPSTSYTAFTDLDTMTDMNFPEGVFNGMGHILSVNGFHVSSNLVVNLTIRIRGEGGLFDKDMHVYSTDFPIYVRSKPLRKEHVADVEQLGLLPHSLKTNIKHLKTHFQFIQETPIMLPGCATAYDQLQKRREFISKILWAINP